MLEVYESSEKLTVYILEARAKALKEPESSYEKAYEAYELAKNRGWQSEEAAALFVMALSCRSMTQLEKCYDLSMDALKLYESLSNSLGIATVLNLIGVVYFYYGKLETALSYFLQALHHLDGVNDPITESRILNNLGEVYRESGDFDAAFEAYDKALKLCETLDMKANVAVILENIGEVYFRKQAFDLSYDYFNKSFDMLLILEDTAILSEVENRIGRMLFLQGRREEAKIRCQNALKRLEDMGNTFYAIEVLMTLAEIKQDEGSIDYLEDLSKAIYYAEVLNARKPLRKLYKLFYEYYEGQGIYDTALFYFKKFHQIELEIESTIVSQKLEIIKMELNKAFEGDTVEKVKNLNMQLENEISQQARLLSRLEQDNKKLDEAVYMDELTQVLNRRGMKEKLVAVWENKTYDAMCIALLMIDIDHFKGFNDTYGHIQGDKCLQQIASTMTAVLTEKAILFSRYGGEEFVCMLLTSMNMKSRHKLKS